ncbi:L-glyceraldehyde 3-phosphate reductase [Flavobacterium jejuense]|uniref:L-glyceraldehyde 3-phosphate reductase n=1 Tax=Flavobacterium jejuense TaxID=1544455 RepID=A0ABX0IUU3_9FLAO|nr:L-glyceraldehyde 3-phosphate reductase [Flavobacterium jejuense]NHN27243.1 L-glyceraldehyde 3-phosphate reductase [Flavobacterium jejuense]
MSYLADKKRYDNMQYKRCGKSGIELPLISLGLWHNFGGVDIFENGRKMVLRAFDLGITHFDLANNYGPPAGSAEENFGKILKTDLKSYRDEMIITSKAGWDMWPGPYGNFGSRKYLIASCNQSLKRMGLEYVDIFYSHRPDPNTPIEETMMALDQIVKSGKALYAGISSYNPEESREAIAVLKSLGTPCLVHQPSYSMFNRWIEDGLLNVLEETGVGSVVFSPLFQGLLTDKYLNGIPQGSRASKPDSFLSSRDINEKNIEKVKALNEIAKKRGQKMSQLALSWVLRDERVTSVIIGASKVSHIEDAVGIQSNLTFSSEELEAIEKILKG